MLVLTRKKDQVLVIGDDIEITVLDIQNDQIRLGISAPKSVKVFRKELFAEIQAENINAAKPQPPVQASDLTRLLNFTNRKP
jgi:carbon storage regulator